MTQETLAFVRLLWFGVVYFGVWFVTKNIVSFDLVHVIKNACARSFVLVGKTVSGVLSVCYTAAIWRRSECYCLNRYCM